MLEVKSTSSPWFGTPFTFRNGHGACISGNEDLVMWRRAISFSFSNPVIDLTYRLGGVSHRHRLNPSANPSQDGSEQILRDRHFRHLEAGVAAMPDDFRSDLERLGLQGAQ